MRQILIILWLCFFFKNTCKAQKEFKVVLIDTLEGFNPIHKDFEIRICLDTNDKTHIRDTILLGEVIKIKDRYSVIFKFYNKYITQFYSESRFVERIDLPLDNIDGFLSLKFSHWLRSDTIKIKKLLVIDNASPFETIKKTTTAKIRDNHLIPISRKIDTIYNLRLKKPETNLILIINDKSYDILLMSHIVEENGTFNSNSRKKNRKVYGNMIKRYNCYYGEIYLDKD
ncbi:MAG: hypothetical protein WC716_14885 [Chitinophagaceae bacterium]|jgi:hypothetical protein